MKEGQWVELIDDNGMLVDEGKILRIIESNDDKNVRIEYRPPKKFCPDCMMLFKNEKFYLKHRRRKHGERKI